MTFFTVSFLVIFFLHSYNCRLAYSNSIPLVNTNPKDTGYSFYRSGVSLENYSPFRVFNKNQTVALKQA